MQPAKPLQPRSSSYRSRTPPRTTWMEEAMDPAPQAAMSRGGGACYCQESWKGCVLLPEWVHATAISLEGVHATAMSH